MSNVDVSDVREMIIRFYPEWAGFRDPRFVSDEIDYKQATVRKVKEQIAQPVLEAMITSGKLDEAIEIIKKLGWDNNLLWRSVPLEGDLNVLHRRNLDKVAFLEAFRDLLYGQEPVETRLDAYSNYIDGAGLPNKWTFPTYFLFFAHPETELFVKPQATKWFLETIGSDNQLGSHPNGAIYGEVKNGS